MSTWSSFEEYYQKISTVSSVVGNLGWDQETMMPPNSAHMRAEQLAYLEAHLHQLKTAPQYIEILERLCGDSSLGLVEKSIAKRFHRDALKSTKVPEKLVTEIAKATVLSQQAWKSAREKSNYNLFRNELKNVIELRKQYAKCIQQPGETLYEALLSEFESEFPIEKIRSIFSSVKKDLVPLAQTIIEKSKRALIYKINPSELSMPIDRQRELNLKVLECIGFDLTRGRLDTTAHPFCSGSWDDVRLTTRYMESDWTNSLYSVLHEGGHGIYEQGVGKAHQNKPKAGVPSMGMHESQSRFWENCIGRSREYAEFMTKFITDFTKGAVTIEPKAYFQHVNKPKYSYIRVDSDEVTYNLHILIRYEIEEALFQDSVSISELNHFWDSKVKEYLGLAHHSDAYGLLQDVHWSLGAFGYFPTYAIGNFIAAEIRQTLVKELSVDHMIRDGDFKQIREWLYRKVHSKGLEKNTLELVESISGHALGTDAFYNYLKEKFSV